MDTDSITHLDGRVRLNYTVPIAVMSTALLVKEINLEGEGKQKKF